jgi:hypothetical protein
MVLILFLHAEKAKMRFGNLWEREHDNINIYSLTGMGMEYKYFLKNGNRKFSFGNGKQEKLFPQDSIVQYDNDVFFKLRQTGCGCTV